MNEAIITLMGVVTGVFLSEGAAWWRNYNHDKKQAESIRSIISIEIDYNLDKMQQFWDILQTEIDLHVGNFRGDRIMTLTDRIQHLNIRNGFSGWSTAVWESQLPAAPSALSKHDLSSVHHFYKQLDWLTTLTQSAALEPRRRMIGERFETAVQNLLRDGNPIPIKIRQEDNGGGKESK